MGISFLLCGAAALTAQTVTSVKFVSNVVLTVGDKRCQHRVMVHILIAKTTVLMKRKRSQQHVQCNFHQALLFMPPFLPSLFPQSREGLPLCFFKGA